MTREQLRENFGDIANKLPLNVSSAEADHNEDEESWQGGENDEGQKYLGQVWEIWDKNSRKVYFISPDLPEQMLRVADDPLHLSGFFPIATPLMFFPKISSLEPVPLYAAYEGQARELIKYS